MKLKSVKKSIYWSFYSIKNITFSHDKNALKKNNYLLKALHAIYIGDVMIGKLEPCWMVIWGLINEIDICVSENALSLINFKNSGILIFF